MLGGVDASCLCSKKSKYGNGCIAPIMDNAKDIWCKDGKLYVTVVMCGEDWRGSKLMGFHHIGTKFAFYEPDSSV